MAILPNDQQAPSDGLDGKMKPLHILLVCLAVVATLFAGSIVLSVFYVEQNRAVQSGR